MTNRNTNSHVNNDLIKDVNISINKDVIKGINNNINKVINIIMNNNINKGINRNINKCVNKGINKDINRSKNTLTVAKGLSAYFLFSKKTVIGYGQPIKFDPHHDIQLDQP